MDYKALNTMIKRYRRFRNEDASAPIVLKEVLELYKLLKIDSCFHKDFIRHLELYGQFLVPSMAEEIRATNEAMQEIRHILKSVPDDLDRNIMTDRYITGMTLEQLGDKYYYSTKTIERICNRYIKCQIMNITCRS